MLINATSFTHRTHPALICASVFLAATSTPALAQSSITAATFGPLTGGAATTTNGITYLNQTLPFTSLAVGSENWSFAGQPTPVVTLRRGGYAPPPDDTFGNYNNRNVVWSYRNSGDPGTTLRSGPFTTTAAVLSTNNVLTGSDNILENAGFNVNGIPLPSQSDIERVDFVLAGGVTASTGLATVIFDRGGLTNHDAFQLAPILSVDANGNPTAYGSLLSVAAGWGQTNLFPGGGATDNLGYTEVTDSTGAGTFAVSLDTRLQQVGGIVIPLSALTGVGETLYGYSLFASDVNPGGNLANLLDVTNATVFPRNTPDSIGGLDPVSGSGFLVTAVPEPGIVALLVGMGISGTSVFVRRRCR